MPDIFELLAKERAAISDMLTWRGLTKRNFKYEYAAIEVTLVEKFNDSLSASKYPSLIEIDGFVSRVGGPRFILRPSLAVNYGVLCEVEDPRNLPTDFEFGRVKAYRVMGKGNSRESILGKLKVTNFEPIHLPTDHLRPGLSVSGAEDILFEGYPDPPEQVKRNLILSLASSPGGPLRHGGITAALLPVKDQFIDLSYELLRDMKKSIPRDLTSEKRVRVSIPEVGNFEISPFPWSMHNASSAELSSEGGAPFQQTKRMAYDERTLGISASGAAPSTLDELWMRVTDFPVLIEQSLNRYSKPANFDLDLAKFIITVHSARPIADKVVEDELLELVQSGLEKLRREYDVLGYSGLVNLDVRSGSPRSILAIAKSMARVYGVEKVDVDLVRNAQTEYINSREDMFDVWAEMGLDYGDAQVSTQKKLKVMGRTAERIYMYLREHPNSTRSEIRENFGRVQDSLFNHAVEQMLHESVIYSSSSLDDRYSAV